MSESKAKLMQQVEHMSRVVQEVAFLLELLDDMDGDIDHRIFNGLRKAFQSYGNKHGT